MLRPKGFPRWLGLGFLHFHSRRFWIEAFDHAGFQVARSFAPAPLSTCFVLEKRGPTR